MNILALIPIALCAAIIYLGESYGKLTSESKKLWYSLAVSQCSAFLIMATNFMPARIVLSVITIISMSIAIVNLIKYSKTVLSRYMSNRNS